MALWLGVLVTVLEDMDSDGSNNLWLEVQGIQCPLASSAGANHAYSTHTYMRKNTQTHKHKITNSKNYFAVQYILKNTNSSGR